MYFAPAVSPGAVTVEPAAAKLLIPNGLSNSFGSWWNVGSLLPRSGLSGSADGRPGGIRVTTHAPPGQARDRHARSRRLGSRDGQSMVQGLARGRGRGLRRWCRFVVEIGPTARRAVSDRGVECALDGGQLASWELTGAAGLSEDESHGQAPQP
jgi:hypothetical protein